VNIELSKKEHGKMLKLLQILLHNFFKLTCHQSQKFNSTFIN